MDQDVALGVTMSITQAEIPFLREAGRLGEYAVVYRVYRQQLGGGFGDQEKHPFAWGVLVYVDTQVARVYSARGLPREWSDLTRLEKWMREQGFWYWWMRNDLEPLSMGSTDEETEGDVVNSDLPEHDGQSAAETLVTSGDPMTPSVNSDSESAAKAATTNIGPEVVPLPTQLFNLVPDREE